MNTFLHPFVKVGKDAEDRYSQARDLQNIIFRSTKLGYAIFSHPCEWSFNHFVNSSQPTPGLLVVCSGLGDSVMQMGDRWQSRSSCAASDGEDISLYERRKIGER